MIQITMEDLKKMSAAALRAHMLVPEDRAQIEQLLRTREAAVWVSKTLQDEEQETEAPTAPAPAAVPVEPTVEEMAAEAAATVPVAQPVPVPSIHEAEDAEWKKVGIAVFRDTAGSVTRVVQDYQVMDEDGTTPIGRPTHLEAGSIPQLMIKQRQCHEQATRAFNRLKKQKLTTIQEPKVEKKLLSEEEIIAAAQESLKEKDAVKAAEVMKSIVDKKYEEREQSAKDKEDFARGKLIAAEFMQKHIHDYNSCKANSEVMKEYLAENKLEFTLDNLEIAFADLMDQGKLAPVPHRRGVDATAAATPNTSSATVEAAAPAPAANPAPVPATPAPAPTPQQTVEPTPSSQPAVPTPTATPAEPQNAAVPARRPGVNGSIPPGTLSAQRPVIGQPTLTKKDIAKMSPQELRAKLRDPKFVSQLEALGIKAR